MRKIFIIIVSIFLFLHSCKKETRKPDNPKEEEIEKLEKSFFEYSIFFYDTIYQNKTYKGYIEYKSDFDTIKSKQGDRRFTLYYAKSTSILTPKYSEFKKQVLDTFGSKNNNTIPIKFKFTKPGVNYVDGFLEDEVYIPVKGDSTKVRIITQDARITFKVFVRDSTLKTIPSKTPYKIKETKPGYL